MIALLASTLATSGSASALNITIGNATVNNGFSGANVGQSFINDPTGAGSLINLDTWELFFQDAGSGSNALNETLTIYAGTGNGGTIIGSSSNTTATSAVSVRWTFNGGLQIVDNNTYTAVLSGGLAYTVSEFIGDQYINGTATQGSTPLSNNRDLAFKGTFSPAAPVPFEFNPALGLGVLGSLVVIKRFVKKKG